MLIAASGDVVHVPEGVQTIWPLAFYDRNITEITLPSTLTLINSEAFNQCTNLKVVNYIGTAEQWAAITIEEKNQPLLKATINYVSATIVQ